MESGVKDMYLLHWWYNLDMEGFVQFNLCVLDKYQRANASDSRLVSNVYNENLLTKEKEKKDTQNCEKCGIGWGSNEYVGDHANKKRC